MVIMCGYNEHILGSRDKCWKGGRERIRSFRLNDQAREDGKEIVQIVKKESSKKDHLVRSVQITEAKENFCHLPICCCTEVMVIRSFPSNIKSSDRAEVVVVVLVMPNNY